MRQLNREQPTEPAAFFSARQLGDRRSLDCIQQRAWLPLDAEAAQTMTGIMDRQGMRKGRAGILDAQNVDEVFGKLIGAACQLVRGSLHWGVIGEKLGIEMPQHRRAGARRENHVAGSSQYFD